MSLDKSGNKNAFQPATPPYTDPSLTSTPELSYEKQKRRHIRKPDLFIFNTIFKVKGKTY